MKRIRIIGLLFMAAMIMGATAFSQEKETRYLFSGAEKDVKVSGFATVFTQFSSIQGDFALSNGGGGALIFNQGFFFGGYGQGVSTRHDYPSFKSFRPSDPEADGDGNVYYNDLRITMGHGGLWTGYIFKSHSIFHLMAASKFGWGSVNLTDRYYHHEYDKYDKNIVTDQVFVIIPEIGGEVNLTKWMKINVTVGYRIVTGLNKEYLYNTGATGHLEEKKYFDQADFNSLEGSINLVFGWFHQ